MGEAFDVKLKDCKINVKCCFKSLLSDAVLLCTCIF